MGWVLVAGGLEGKREVVVAAGFEGLDTIDPGGSEALVGWDALGVADVQVVLGACVFGSGGLALDNGCSFVSAELEERYD